MTFSFLIFPSITFCSARLYKPVRIPLQFSCRDNAISNIWNQFAMVPRLKLPLLPRSQRPLLHASRAGVCYLCKCRVWRRASVSRCSADSVFTGTTTLPGFSCRPDDTRANNETRKRKNVFLSYLRCFSPPPPAQYNIGSAELLLDAIFHWWSQLTGKPANLVIFLLRYSVSLITE